MYPELYSSRTNIMGGGGGNFLLFPPPIYPSAYNHKHKWLIRVNEADIMARQAK